ncbi:MAG: hypothetical protein RR404_01830 [Bacilli bacterium]
MKVKKMTKKQKITDMIFLIEIVLLICLILFSILGLFVNELQIIAKIILTVILLIMGINGRKTNRKLLTYLYYFSSFCSLINVIVGIING